VRRCAHRLNGSAGTFGFARAGRMAAAMEAVARRWLADPALDRDRRAHVLATFVAAARPLFSAGAVVPRATARCVWLLGLRDKFAAGVAAEAAGRGYVAERVAPEDLDEALADGAPFAVVAFTPAPEHPGLAPALLVEIVPAPTGVGGSAAAPPPAAGAAPRARVTVDAGASAVLDAIERLGNTGASGIAGAAGAAPPVTVLILDDDPVVRAVVGVAAAAAGLSPVLTGHADAFRAALAAARPALMVVDVEVGDESGLNLVVEVRGRADCAGIPVLILSGHDDAATRESAARAGASDFLVKPADVAALTATLAAWRGRVVG
ncbi:MAG: response regulator, partial [Gemmatimonadota bacterium]|nr:response regulator [Gemmatimonadota bacterium]